MSTILQVSRAALINFIQKLHLEKGDVLVVKDPSLLPQLEALGAVTPFNVPVVFCPQGVQVLKRTDLLNLLEQLEESDKSVLEPYQISGAPV